MLAARSPASGWTKTEILMRGRKTGWRLASAVECDDDFLKGSNDEKFSFFEIAKVVKSCSASIQREGGRKVQHVQHVPNRSKSPP